MFSSHGGILTKGYSRKKYLGGEDGRRYIFYGWLVRKVIKLYGSLVFDQIEITVIETLPTPRADMNVGFSPNLIIWVVGIYSFAKLKKMDFTCLFVCFVCFCCFTSHVNSYGHCGTVSSLNHTFSWAGLSKRLTSNLCTYFRL